MLRRYYTKALLSALDGALRAEEQLQIIGAKPPFTVVPGVAIEMLLFFFGLLVS